MLWREVGKRRSRTLTFVMSGSWAIRIGLDVKDTGFLREVLSRDQSDNNCSNMYVGVPRCFREKVPQPSKHYAAVHPPSSVMIEPVMKEASSEHK
jgi:hypothetical protein